MKADSPHRVNISDDDDEDASYSPNSSLLYCGDTLPLSFSSYLVLSPLYLHLPPSLSPPLSLQVHSKGRCGVVVVMDSGPPGGEAHRA